MNTRLTALSRRRAALVAQSAAQRDELGRCVQPWQTPIAFVDIGMALARRVRAHPLALVIGVLLLFRSRSSRLSLLTSRIWTGWQIFQSLYNRPSQPRG